MNDTITILNQINILYDRKNNLEQLTLLLNGNVPKEKNLFSDDGKVITNIKLALKDVDPKKIARNLPEIVSGKGVQEAVKGVIQDPAGSAINSKSKPSGSGASGVIYGKFKDLEPIPFISPGESKFNSTTGVGKKILHTHSYTLGGDPRNEIDRQKVLNNITDSYYNTILKFNENKPNLQQQDQDILNLVPVSASIYAGDFAIEEGIEPYNYKTKHLHPSYTMVALVKAIDKAIKYEKQIPKLYIYFYDSNVANNADEIRDDILRWTMQK